MHEEEFRDRFRAAVGEAPDEVGAAQRAAAVLRLAPPQRERSGPPRAMVLVAGALALLVLAGLLGPRVLRALPRATSPAGPGAASPPPASPGAAAATCRALPVVVTDDSAFASAPPADPLHDYPSALPRYTAGFVSVATGRFTADSTAAGGGMPFSRMYVKEQWSPRSYDPVLKRWLPASRSEVSPDHRAYAYVIQLPLATGKGAAFDTTTLHVYDVTTGQDRALWTTHDQIGFDPTWESDGIHASTVPNGGGRLQSWIVDPVSGAVKPGTTTAPVPGLSFAEMRGYGITGPSGFFGRDDAGHPIVLAGTRDPGTSQEYFVGGPNGQRIVIHDGVMGDSFDFDPNGFTVDGDSLWALNYDGTAIWRWAATSGLRRIALTGIPQHKPYVSAQVVGPCL